MKLILSAVIALAMAASILHVAVVSALAASGMYEIPQGTEMTTGALVVAEEDSKVRPAKQTEDSRVFGAVTALEPSLEVAGKVGVTTAGITPVLVSDIGGAIQTGDRIAVSPIAGVGMKSELSGWVVGIAQADFSASDHAVARQDVEVRGGTRTNVTIKELPVLLSTTYFNPGSTTTAPKNPVQQLLGSLAGRNVSNEQAIVVLGVFGLSITLLVAMVYSAVRHSLISIGRNPLADSKITRTLVIVLVAALLVIIGAMFVIRTILAGGA